METRNQETQKLYKDLNTVARNMNGPLIEHGNWKIINNEGKCGLYKGLDTALSNMYGPHIEYGNRKIKNNQET